MDKFKEILELIKEAGIDIRESMHELVAKPWKKILYSPIKGKDLKYCFEKIHKDLTEQEETNNKSDYLFFSCPIEISSSIALKIQALERLSQLGNEIIETDEYTFFILTSRIRCAFFILEHDLKKDKFFILLGRKGETIPAEHEPNSMEGLFNSPIF